MISVITACYNSEKTIQKTLESMLSQTYSDFEYIIVDGESTDATMDIIREYVPKFDGKMHVRSEKDNGIYDAMNKGIERCKGTLIGILNSDDWYEPDTIEKVVKAYTGEKYEVVYGMLKTFSEGKMCSISFHHHDFLREQMISHPTCFVTKKAYEDLGMFDSLNYRSAADYELLLRYQSNDRVRFTPVYEILSNFASGGISSSSVGRMETIRLKHALGIISRKKYFLSWMKIKIKDLIGSS